MDIGLWKKTAVVTGGSKGIGRAVAEAFLAEGARVAVCARKAEELEQMHRELGEPEELYREVVDVTCEEAVYAFGDHVAKRFGGIDAWVNNVGASVPKENDEFTGSDIDFMTAVCFKSAVFGSQAAFRHMKKEGGVIVNISSLAARCPSAGRSTLYGPMKAAVVNLTQTLAGEYAAYGVRVCCVMPGFTVTPLVKATISDEELAYNAKGTLLGRLAKPEEIAAPVVFLCGKGASYMTGTTIEVSGGRSVTLNPAYSWERKSEEEA